MDAAKSPSESSRYDEFRKWSSTIFAMANSSTPRALFLQQSLTAALKWAACDRIRAVVLTASRRFACAVDRAAIDQPALEIRNRSDLNEDHNLWTDGSNETLEELCRNLFAGCHASVPSGINTFGGIVVKDDDPYRELRELYGSGSGKSGLQVAPSCRSLLVIPIEGTDRRLGLLELESDKADLFGPSDTLFYDLVSRTFGIAIEWRNRQVVLRERVKELDCLYGITRLVAHAGSSLDELLQKVTELLPPAWLYPDVAAARIRLDDRSYSTSGAQDMIHKMTADVIVDDSRRGSVEVGYTVDKPRIDEGPFLNEERRLIDTIAKELSFIIEQRLYNEEKTRLRDQLRHADRLATIGQLAAGIAHELNEPLSNILGFAQLVTKDEGISPQSGRDIEKIIAGTLHARQIIKELLIFARETEPVKASFNLNELINDGLFFLESRFKKVGIDLDCRLAPDLPNVKADRLQILQVLTNLVVNAVQAMPSGGKLTIHTGVENSAVELVVEDSGVGINDSIIDKIFNPFFTTKDVSEGTGLGLSVVHGIVTAHRGTISVESAPGAGSKFTIHLPVDEPGEVNGESGHE